MSLEQPLLVVQETPATAKSTGEHMTREELVGEFLSHAKQIWAPYWATLADEQRLRLSGMEAELTQIISLLREGLWALVNESLESYADEAEGRCGCGRRRERRRGSMSVDVLGSRTKFACSYFYCRHCHRGISPVRRWLGVESGGVSLGFERALTALTTRLPFGDFVESTREHHNQNVDRTKAERVTYSVAQDAEAYLTERRKKARDKARSNDSSDVDQLVFTADGGAVPVGKMMRPTTTDGPKTEVRGLAKGTRDIAGREARFISVHPAESTANRVVDCHIAPYNQTSFTGSRMFAAAADAGLSDTCMIHGVFDMGKWIHSQFDTQFEVYEHSGCADIMHVADYLVAAARVLVRQDNATSWGMEHKRRLLKGQFDHVLSKLQSHVCDENCIKDENKKCLVRVAERYMTNNRTYMENYPDFMIRDLPVGSGEAESGIRHVIKRRMSVAGAWTETHAGWMLGLLAIRASGWWDDFWNFRHERDKQAFRDRKEGRLKVEFRNRRKSGVRLKAA
jgi:hypothetical protein